MTLWALALYYNCLWHSQARIALCTSCKDVQKYLHSMASKMGTTHEGKNLLSEGANSFL